MKVVKVVKLEKIESINTLFNEICTVSVNSPHNRFKIFISTKYFCHEHKYR